MWTEATRGQCLGELCVGGVGEGCCKSQSERGLEGSRIEEYVRGLDAERPDKVRGFRPIDIEAEDQFVVDYAFVASFEGLCDGRFNTGDIRDGIRGDRDGIECFRLGIQDTKAVLESRNLCRYDRRKGGQDSVGLRGCQILWQALLQQAVAVWVSLCSLLHLFRRGGLITNLMESSRSRFLVTRSSYPSDTTSQNNILDDCSSQSCDKITASPLPQNRRLSGCASPSW